MTWNPIDEPIDYVVLAQKRSPGIATIDGAKSARQWDERRGYGLSGATVVFRGIHLVKFKLELRFSTTEHWNAWHAWRPLVQKPPLGTRPRALDIVHPILEMLEVRSIVVTEVGQVAPSGDLGEWAVELEMLEFRRPQFTLSRPDGSQQQTNDPFDREIERLTSQFQELAR